MNGLPRWALAVLGLSVTLNLVGLGWIIGRSTTQAGSPPVALHGFDIELAREGEFRSARPSSLRRTLHLEPPAPVAPVAPGAEAPPPVAAEVPRDVSRGLKWIVATLPPERREHIAIDLDARVEPLLEETEKVFVIREEIREELARSEFEKQRLEAALARLREQLVAIQTDSHRILADVAEELSEEEREALAASLASSLAERKEVERDAALAAEAQRIAEAARRALDGDAPVRVYRRGFVLEHPGDEEAAPETP